MNDLNFPAFPSPPYFGPMLDPDGSGAMGHGSTPGFRGMSLRDFFAANALQAWIIRSQNSETFADDTAKWAYQHADAMLKARNSP